MRVRRRAYGGGGPGAEARRFREMMGPRFELVAPEVWRACVEAMVERALRGDVAAFRQLAPWMAGMVGDDEAPEPAGTGVVIYLPKREIEP